MGAPLCAKKEDTRPLKDPRWRKEKAQFFLEFAGAHGWPIDQSIDMKAFCSCPSNSEVMAILQFLFNLTNPEIQIENLDGDMVLMLFKRVLKYPYTIPVARKVIQITPLTWHTMFGAIIWFVEKIKADEDEALAERARSAATDGPRQFHAWVAGMYCTAQQGLDDWRRMELDLLQNMERQVRDHMAHTAASQKEMSRMAEQVQELRKYSDELTSLQQECETLRRDLQNFTLFLANMQEHTTSVAASIAEEERTGAELGREAAAREREKACVLHALHSQELTKDEEERLRRKKALLHAQLADLSSRSKLVAGDMQGIEHQLHRKVDQLNAMISKVNGESAVLHCCPGGKHPYPGDVLLRINDDSESPNAQALQPDPRDLQQAFDSLRQHYVQKQQATADGLRVLKHELRQRDAVRQEQHARAEALAADVARLEGSCAELARRLRSCEMLRQEMETNALKHHREIEQLTAAISAGVSNLIRFKEVIEPTIAGVFLDYEARLQD
eukprot:EG_transcript_7526